MSFFIQEAGIAYGKEKLREKAEREGKVADFESKGNVKSHPCGKKSFLDLFRKPVYIKDLDGKILYEGRGTFQRTLENAVKDGIELPKADLRNQKFFGVQLYGAKLQGASFENSSILNGTGFGEETKSIIVKADLRDVNFKNTNFGDLTKLDNSDVAGADFNKFPLYQRLVISFYEIKNLDKAKNVRKSDLAVWEKAQPRVKETQKWIQTEGKKIAEQAIKDAKNRWK